MNYRGLGSRYGAPPVDMAALERVFYDDLCRPKPGEPQGEELPRGHGVLSWADL